MASLTPPSSGWTVTCGRNRPRLTLSRRNCRPSPATTRTSLSISKNLASPWPESASFSSRVLFFFLFSTNPFEKTTDLVYELIDLKLLLVKERRIQSDKRWIKIELDAFSGGLQNFDWADVRRWLKKIHEQIELRRNRNGPGPQSQEGKNWPALRQDGKGDHHRRLRGSGATAGGCQHRGEVRRLPHFAEILMGVRNQNNNWTIASYQS